MLGTYYYHEIIRRTVIAFGTVFNDIYIRHKDSSGDSISEMKVALAYGPIQKFLARIQQQPELNKPIAITLPRMSFEMTSIQYDATRKSNITQTFKASDGNQLKKVYLPVPYNIGFQLNVMTKLQDDALQIVEQILPYFQPSYNLTVNLVEGINEKKDIPIILENVTMQDDYEGNFTTRRVLIYTLRFTAKTYLFGPISTATTDIIKKTTISYLTGTDTTNTSREVVYTAEPRAIKNYTGTVLTNLAKDIAVTDTIIQVNDASSITNKTYLDIEGEEVYVTYISGNAITVERGKDGTTVTSHLTGSPVKSITSSDNALIEYGDDFGFSGTIN